MSFNDDFLNSLTPSEIQQLLGYGDFADEDYGGDVYDFGFAPSEYGMGVQPQVDYFTTKGKVNYGDIAQEAKRVNLLQDYGSLSVDNILSGYAGGGAYDVGAFTPTYDYGEPVNLPGRRKAESLAKTSGWQGFVTDLILNQGLSPAEAEQQLYATISAPDDESLSDTDRAMKEALTESMAPLMTSPSLDQQMPGGTKGLVTKSPTGQPYDADTIRQFTTNVWSDLMEDPDFKYQDPESGLFYDRTPEEALIKTPQMAAFDKFGIPYPTATYEDPKYMDEFARSESGMGPEEIAGAGDTWAAKHALQVAQAGKASQAGRESGVRAGELERAFAESQAEQRPMTKWDAVMQAATSGGDQEAAMADFMRRYGEAEPSTFTAPNVRLAPNERTTFGVGPNERRNDVANAEGGLASVFDFGGVGGGETPPMISDGGPLSGTNRAGDRVLATDPSLRRAQAWDFAAALTGRKAPIPEVRRTTQADVDKQRTRANTSRNRSAQQQNALFRDTYNDPRMAQAAALGRALALVKAGQTPFKDAMAARNTNARLMLSGA
jgi:hypothetical protein